MSFSRTVTGNDWPVPIDHLRKLALLALGRSGKLWFTGV